MMVMWLMLIAVQLQARSVLLVSHVLPFLPGWHPLFSNVDQDETILVGGGIGSNGSDPISSDPSGENSLLLQLQSIEIERKINK